MKKFNEDNISQSTIESLIKDIRSILQENEKSVFKLQEIYDNLKKYQNRNNDIDDIDNSIFTIENTIKRNTEDIEALKSLLDTFNNLKTTQII